MQECRNAGMQIGFDLQSQVLKTLHVAISLGG
jgi:hypothetical protein